MTQASGTILSIDHVAGGLRASIAVDAGSYCRRCAAGKGCGAAIFGSSRRVRQLEAALPDGRAWQIGDPVTLTLTSHRVLSVALIVYGLPLLGAMAGSMLAYLAGAEDPAAAIAALAGVGTGILAARLRLRNHACLQQLSPRVQAPDA